MSSKPNYNLMFKTHYNTPVTNNYNKLITGGNNPQITKAMRFAEIIRNQRSVIMVKK